MACGLLDVIFFRKDGKVQMLQGMGESYRFCLPTKKKTMNYIKGIIYPSYSQLFPGILELVAFIDLKKNFNVFSVCWDDH